MPFKAFKTLDLGSISSGAVAEKSWPSDDNYTIKRIYFVEKTDASLSNVLTTVRIGDVALCKEDVPCRMFGTNLQNAVELDVSLGKGQTIVVAVKNNTTTSVALYAVLELWKD
jgi:hypothetical protein